MGECCVLLLRKRLFAREKVNLGVFILRLRIDACSDQPQGIQGGFRGWLNCAENQLPLLQIPVKFQDPKIPIFGAVLGAVEGKTGCFQGYLSRAVFCKCMILLPMIPLCSHGFWPRSGSNPALSANKQATHVVAFLLAERAVKQKPLGSTSRALLGWTRKARSRSVAQGFVDRRKARRKQSRPVFNVATPESLFYWRRGRDPNNLACRVSLRATRLFSSKGRSDAQDFRCIASPIQGHALSSIRARRRIDLTHRRVFVCTYRSACEIWRRILGISHGLQSA